MLAIPISIKPSWKIWYDWPTLEAKHILSLPYLNSLYINTNMNGGVLFETELHCKFDNTKQLKVGESRYSQSL